MTDTSAEAVERLAAECEGDCSRVRYGQCSTRSCLVRGGWIPSQTASYDQAACQEFQVAATLRALASENAALRAERDAAVADGAKYLAVVERRDETIRQIEEAVWMLSKSMTGEAVLPSGKAVRAPELLAHLATVHETCREKRDAAQADARRLRKALETAESEARRYAGHYPEHSDGRNTFVMLADRIASLSPETRPHD